MKMTICVENWGLVDFKLFYWKKIQSKIHAHTQVFCIANDEDLHYPM